ILLATSVVPMRTDYVEALGKLKKGHVALCQAKPAPSCLLSSSPSASCRSCPFLAPQVTVRRTWQSDKLRFTRAANPARRTASRGGCVGHRCPDRLGPIAAV